MSVLRAYEERTSNAPYGCLMSVLVSALQDEVGSALAPVLVLISRLLLCRCSVFGRQFLDSGGMSVSLWTEFLDCNNDAQILIDGLIILSALARASPDFYPAIRNVSH